jgi:uncharacterized protein
MSNHNLRLTLLFTVLVLTSCTAAPLPPQNRQSETKMTNPVFHFEIAVTDMDRAVKFYEAVLGHKLTRRNVDGYDMAFFPRADGKPGASGALAKGDVYVPSKTGAIIYFDVADIDETLRRAGGQGAKILYPKKDIGDGGFVAEIEDSEGNRIALNSIPE